MLYKQFLIRNAGLNIADNRHLTFQTIIDIAGARSVFSDAVCMGSPVKIIIYKKT